MRSNALGVSGMFKDMCGLIDYIASVDPKFKEYVMAYKAKQRKGY